MFLKNIISIYFIGILLIGISVSSCQKQRPQLPSNKTQIVDSAEIKLRDFNKEVTLGEDSAIVLFLTSQNLQFTKTESGIWYYFEKQNNTKQKLQEKVVNFSYQMFSMNGLMLDLEENKTIEFGKKQIPTGLEEGLKLMQKGDAARFIIPSYLAYGAQGNEKVEPYTTLIYFVERH